MSKSDKGKYIAKPSPTLVDEYNREFDRDFDNKIKEEILADYFRNKYPCNDNESNVLVKLTLLNSFYNTQIFNRDLVKMAKHIVALQIDEDLRSDCHAVNISLVERIAYGISEFKTEDMKNAYSFASKYCSWHEPEKYPIVDSYAKGMLYYINENSLEGKNYYGASFFQRELNSYKMYCAVYDKFMEQFGLSGYTYKQIDKYLWTYAPKYEEEKCENIGLSNSDK